MRNTEQFLSGLLDLRRQTKKDLLARGDTRIPTDDERKAYQLDLYVKSGSMGSKSIPLNRG
jgi:hypothetical protein